MAKVQKKPAKRPAVKARPATKNAPTAKAKPAAQKARPAKAAGGPTTYFFTGFPGFIGRRLVQEIAKRNRDARFLFLVQEKFLDAAKQCLAALEASLPGIENNAEFLIGDLAVDGLGFDTKTRARVVAETDEVWHLAAAYDLAVPDKIAWSVNVDGTRRILDLCESVKRLRKLVYFSTCYVTGLRTGLTLEDELDMGQGFKNNYEATKFEAEALVRERLDKIPAVIFRPSVVIGDSHTGETDKFDGPYYFIRFLAEAEQRGYTKPFKGLPMLSLGPGRAFFNFVPVDFLVDATLHIAADPGALGKTFAICDPDPLTTREFYDELYTRFGARKTIAALPSSAVAFLAKLPGLRTLLHMPDEVLTYSDHQVVYDCRNTLAALQDSDIRCPSLRNYLDTLIAYVKDHLDKTGKYAKY